MCSPRRLFLAAGAHDLQPEHSRPGSECYRSDDGRFTLGRPRIYFALERTLLAWLRTGLALMGVGFAVARFALFLREMQATQAHGPIHQTSVSVWSGVALVLLGVAVNRAAMARHIQLTRTLISGTWRPEISAHGVVLAATLGLIGVGMAVYLVFIR